MASSNRTGLGRKKKRSQQVLAITVALAEVMDEFILARKLYELTYEAWRIAGQRPRKVTWTYKEFCMLISQSGLFEKEKRIYNNKLKVHYKAIMKYHHKV